MKGKQLRKAVLLGMTLSMAVWTTGMAQDVGQITNPNESVTDETITVSYDGGDTSQGAVHFTEGGGNLNVSLNATGTGEDAIDISSTGYGIRVENEYDDGEVVGEYTGEIKLNSQGGGNSITFGDGSGISANSGAAISLNAAGVNMITNGDGGYDKDGINAGADNTGNISLTGASNVIRVAGLSSDGIYTETGSESDETMTAETGNNTIEAGNNAIDHRGSGTVELKAVNGGNILTADEGDGIRVGGNGDVIVNAKYNTITAADDGLLISSESGNNASITVTASGADENGIGNYIDGNNGINIAGQGSVSVTAQDSKNQIMADQIGINVTAGNANVTAKENVIEAGNTGINAEGGGSADGANSQVTLQGDTNIISISNAGSSLETGYIYGINAAEYGIVTIKPATDNAAAQSQIILDNVHGAARGVYANKGGQVTIDQNSLLISVNRLDAENGGTEEEKAKYVYGVAVNVDDMETQIGAYEDSFVNITTANDMTINVKTQSETNRSVGVYTTNSGQVDLTAENGMLSVKVEEISDDLGGYTAGLKADGGGSIEVEAEKGIDIDALNQESNDKSISVFGISVQSLTGKDSGIITLNTAGDLTIDAHADGIKSSASGISAVGTKGEIQVEQADNVTVSVSGKTAVAMTATSTGKNTVNAAGDVSLTANTIENGSAGYARGVYLMNGQNVVTAGGSIAVKAEGLGTSDTVQGIYAFGSSGDGGAAELTGADIRVEAINGTEKTYGIYAEGLTNTTVALTAETGNNEIISDGIGILAGGTGVAASASQHLTTVSLNAVQANNIIQAGTIGTHEDGGSLFDVGGQNAVEAAKGTSVSLSAKEENRLFGAVYASGTGNGSDDTATSVTIAGLADESGTAAASAANYIGSAAAIANAGDLNTDESFAGKSVISAIYAEDGAQITVNGEQNVIRTYADNTNTDQLERTVWAYNGAEIDIDGTTLISTDRYETSPNSLDIAIAAGSAVGLTEEAVNAQVTDPSVVNLTYGSYTDADGNSVSSSITGDILAAYTGQVNIAPKNADAKINITGNLLAGNNGELTVNLGNGGILTGRADDYGDAGVIDNSGHGTEFFDPAFSSAIYKGGVINLTMGENSRWNVTGQSWITSVNTENSSNALIDLVSANTDRNATAHALTIYDMKGNATFNMNLDGDRTVSDMLYMKNADGEYLVNVIDPVTQADMYAAREGGIFDGLRFATVGAGSHATFRAITYGQGLNNIEYEVGTDQYADNEENVHYNSSDGSGSGDTEKPGSAMADGFFTSTGTPGATTAENGIMTMAAVEGMGTDTGANGTTVDETTNYKLIGVKSTELSNAGKTVVSMSKINYSNAVYMDRLNKRMGEARYIDGDEGLWVRMRHDRIGKSDAFRSMNTMMELGYDRKVGDREDGEHRQGMAIDYMRGTADYKNVAGEGDVRRGGVWFYDTWLGDKGHYTDYVLKFGRLSNDFEVYSELGEKITGDYSNFVYSASAEYGRKKDLGSNWYIEPQAQIQYAHVTDADYTTSQGTAVQLDAIDSLIGRVGFRLGKDLGDKSTFYIKADILHEFLGDQDIEARDATGFLDTTYENEGTWYDIGLGFSHQFSKGTYMFLDMEKSIGNDNEDTYQFNFGMNWKV